MSLGANLEIDPATRIANLEAALFGGPNPAGGPPFPAFTGIVQSALQIASASAAITIKQGTVLITKSTAALMTLAIPVAGNQAAGGDDGKVLTIIAGTAHAHTVTTPADGINGADDTVTYAAVGDYVQLVAYNGAWYAIVGGPTPAALSEV